MGEPGTAPGRPWARAPMRLHDPDEVPLLPDLLTAHDMDSAWSGVRKLWGDAGPVDMGAGVRGWLVTGYEQIVALARDSGMVTTDLTAWNRRGPTPALLRPFQLQPAGHPAQMVETASGPQHARLRGPLQDVLDAVETSEIGRVTSLVCQDLAGRLTGLPGADLMRDYATPVAHRVFARLLGLDWGTGRQVFELADALAAGTGDVSGIDELSFLLGGRAMRDAGGKLTPAGLLARHPDYQGAGESVGGMLSLAAGASLGVQAWLGQTLLRAVSEPGFYRRLTGGRLGMDEALDEVLWRASPVTVLAPRYALRAGHLFGEGTWVEQGDAVLLAAGAAASDPQVRGEGTWDGLGNRAHLAFGAGPHRCPAPGQARLIVRSAVETLLRLTEPVLATNAEQIRWTPDLRYRRPESLPVTFRRTAPGG